MPDFSIVSRWMRAAVSRVVAAKEMTSTAIRVRARALGSPRDSRNAPPPITKAAALLERQNTQTLTDLRRTLASRYRQAAADKKEQQDEQDASSQSHKKAKTTTISMTDSCFWKDDVVHALPRLMHTKAQRLEDQAKRVELYDAAQTLLHNDGGALIPMFANYIMGLSKKVGHSENVAANWSMDGGKAAERWWFA